MATEITTRAAKGAPLTYIELDENFENLRDTADAASDAVIALGGKANASALGVSTSATNMGAFTGTTIPDNQTAKQGMQALETRSELAKGFPADSQAAIAATGIPAIIIAITTNGYTVSGDGGAASYKRAVSEPSHPGKVQSADGAWWEIADNVLNVLQFGAKRDSTGVGIGTDAAAAFNSAIAACAALKRNLKIPSGGYRLSAPLVYTKSAVSGDAGFIVNISGDGAAMTRLYCSAGGIQVIGSATAGIYGSFFTINDLYMQGSGTGNGLDVLLCGFVSVSKVRATGFEKGCFLKGVISTNLFQPFLDSNTINLDAVPDDGDVYPPNAITITSPWISGAAKVGIHADQPALLDINGGSIEGNGWDTVNWSEAERGGVVLEQPGTGGHNAANFFGVYIEHNSGIADVLVYGATRRCTVNFIGNTFTRLTSTAGPTKHCIYLTASTQRVVANINGNGFGELGGGFVPDATQRYVQADNSPAAYTVFDLANDYMTDAARPDYRAIRALNSNSLPYASGFITSAGVLENDLGNNISLVEHVSTGRYKITCAQGAIGRKVGVVSASAGLFGGTFTSDTTSVTVDIYNAAGVLTDGEFWIDVKVVGRW